MSFNRHATAITAQPALQVVDAGTIFAHERIERALIAALEPLDQVYLVVLHGELPSTCLGHLRRSIGWVYPVAFRAFCGISVTRRESGGTTITDTASVPCFSSFAGHRFGRL